MVVGALLKYSLLQFESQLKAGDDEYETGDGVMSMLETKLDVATGNTSCGGQLMKDSGSLKLLLLPMLPMPAALAASGSSVIESSSAKEIPASLSRPSRKFSSG